MIRCAKCDNDTRTSSLVSAHGDVMIAGTLGTEPAPVIAQVCTACGYIELYAPQPVHRPERQAIEEARRAPEPSPAETPVPSI